MDIVLVPEDLRFIEIVVDEECGRQVRIVLIRESQSDDIVRLVVKDKDLKDSLCGRICALVDEGKHGVCVGPQVREIELCVAKSDVLPEGLIDLPEDLEEDHIVLPVRSFYVLVKVDENILEADCTLGHLASVVCVVIK